METQSVGTENTSEKDARRSKFYVVSKRKFAILAIATFGLYFVYWFYINWRNYRYSTNQKILPILRSIFYIVFTHSLFNKVDATLKSKELSLKWSPGTIATFFVLITIAANISDRISYYSDAYFLNPFDYISLLFLFLRVFIMLKVQKAINISQDDSDGSSNNKLTVYNYLWIFLGCVLWLMIAIGILESFGVIIIEDL